MKLLYIESSLAIYGGIERVLTEKINWLVEYGKCEVCLFLANQGEHPIVFPLSSKVDVRNVGIMFHQIYRYSGLKRYYKSFWLHYLFRECLHDVIEHFSPDVIIFTRLEFACDIMIVRGRIPVVYESHNSYYACKYEKYGWLRKIQIKLWHHALKKANVIVALTNGDASEWKKINPRVQVVPNIVHLNDTGRYSDCRKQSVIFVGRFSAQKDVGNLLRIWEIVHQRNPEWQLHIYGGYGDEQDAVKEKINNLNANILVHEPTSDIHNKYIKNSILLLTSLYEPFGLVIPEAMSCGLPVVSFDCPYGPRDIITDGKDGFLINKRDVIEFSNRLCQLIKDENLRIRMGQAAIETSKRYATEQIMPAWKELFEQLCH